MNITNLSQEEIQEIKKLALSPKQRLVYEFFESLETDIVKMTTKQFQEQLKLSDRTITLALKKLRSRGYIEKLDRSTYRVCKKEE